MKAKILSLALAICMLMSLSVVFPATAQAASPVTICNQKTVVDVLGNWSNMYNSDNGTNVPKFDGVNMVLHPGSWAEFSVNVEETGYYTLDVKAMVPDVVKHLWKTYVDGVQENAFYTWFIDGAAYYDEEVGDMYLTAGTHTLKFENAGTRWNYFTQFRLVKKAKDTKSIWLLHDEYTSGANGDGSALTLHTGRPVLNAGSYVEYNVNVAEAGKYLMYIQSSAQAHGGIPTVTVNGNDIQGLKMRTAYVSNAAHDTALSPVCYVDLKAGDNTVRFTNANSKLYLRGFKLEPTEENVGFAIQADAPTSSTGNPGKEASCLVLAYGKTASYEIDVPSDGTYLVSMYASLGTRTVYSLLVDGVKVGTEGFAPQDNRACKKYDLFEIELTAGKRTLTVAPEEATSGHYFACMLVEKINPTVKTLTADGAIAVSDDSITTIDAKNYYNAYNQGTFGTNTLTECSTCTGPKIVVADKAIYKVNVDADGVYKVTFKYASNTNKNIAVVKVDGEEQLRTRLLNMGADVLYTMEAGDITLTAGVHEITITSYGMAGNNGASFCLDEFTLEKKSRPSKAIWVFAQEYSKEIDATLATDSTSTAHVTGEGSYMSFQRGDTLEYTVNAPFQGVYRLDILAGHGNHQNYVISVNGELAEETTGEGIPKKTTGGLTIQTLQPICDVYLNEGENVISITNDSPGHYFAKIKLDYLGTDELTSIFKLATDYAEAWDAKTNSSTAGVDGGVNVTFGPGDWLTWNVAAMEAGYYKVSVLASNDITTSTGDAAVLVNAEDPATATATTAGQIMGSGSWEVLRESDLGIVYLTGGADKVTLKQPVSGNTKYLYAIILEPIVTIDSTTVVAGDKTEIDLQLMLGEQKGAEHMVVGNLNGIRIFKENSASYNLDVKEAGKYNVFMTTFIPKNYSVEVGSAIGDAEASAVVKNADGKTFTTFKAGTFDLAAGETTISISAVSDDFGLGILSIEKVEDFEIDLVKAGTFYNAITDGDVTANVILRNGAFEGENLMYTFAVYETNANGAKKLIKVDTKTADAVDGTLPLNITGITFAEGCTYSATVYVWDSVTYCGEAKVF